MRDVFAQAATALVQRMARLFSLYDQTELPSPVFDPLKSDPRYKVICR